MADPFPKDPEGAVVALVLAGALGAAFFGVARRRLV